MASVDAFTAKPAPKRNLAEVPKMSSGLISQEPRIVLEAATDLGKHRLQARIRLIDML